MFVRWANAPGPITAFYRLFFSTFLLLPFFASRAKANPAIRSLAAAGACLVLQDHFGGKILKTRVGPAWHFYNRIEGVRLDTTADQFAASVEYLDVPSSREEAFADTNQAQYLELSRRFADALARERGVRHR